MPATVAVAVPLPYRSPIVAVPLPYRNPIVAVPWPNRSRTVSNRIQSYLTVSDRYATVTVGYGTATVAGKNRKNYCNQLKSIYLTIEPNIETNSYLMFFF